MLREGLNIFPYVIAHYEYEAILLTYSLPLVYQPMVLSAVGPVGHDWQDDWVVEYVTFFFSICPFWGVEPLTGDSIIVSLLSMDYTMTTSRHGLTHLRASFGLEICCLNTFRRLGF